VPTGFTVAGDDATDVAEPDALAAAAFAANGLAGLAAGDAVVFVDGARGDVGVGGLATELAALENLGAAEAAWGGGGMGGVASFL
jgi:hypothetical protein